MPSPRLRIGATLLTVALAFLAVAWLERQASSNAERLRPRTISRVAPAATIPPGESAAAQSPQRAHASPPGATRGATVVEAREICAVFTDWLTLWRRADSMAEPALVARGRELAIARRAVLKRLIPSDPELALELAVSPSLAAELPAEIRAQLERWIDARGDYEVNISCQGPATRIDRVVTAQGETLATFVFGRRLHQATKFGLPLHGIAIDEVMALAEAPYRVLDDAEKVTRGIEAERVAVLVGQQVLELAGPGELETLRERLVAAESVAGPHVPEAHRGPAEPATPPTAALTSPPSWVNGEKRVLWIKIDFDDDIGAAYTDAELEATGVAVNEFFRANSQDKTSFSWAILPAVLRMPREKAYYNSSGSTTTELYNAARAAAKSYDDANGATGAWDPAKFDRFLVLHRRMAVYLFGGVAQIGGPRVGLNNTVSPGTVAHELGHTQSLYHSHFWLPTGTTAVGAGTHIEYGDVFDIMGGGGIAQHFNVSHKHKLGYLDDSSVTPVSEAGTYRLARHDEKNASGIRGLRIAPADLGYEYWVEHRRVPPTGLSSPQQERLQSGVLLHWGTEKAPKITSGPGTYLLDNTPGSAAGARDAVARTGETFVDPDTGISVTPLGTGGTAPNEYVDVRVAFGAVNGNRNPTLQADVPPGTLFARSNIVFTSTGSDPDGDPIYFRWDFGDGSFQPNHSSITRRFVKGGEYALRVSAHDGKGGIAVRMLPVNVVDPLVNWTQRGAGVTTQPLYDVVFGGDRFVAVGINQTVVTSPDGITWTRVTFPGGNSLTGIAHDGTRFVASGYRFTNATQKGLAAYSTDGRTWTLVNIDTGLAQFWGIAHGAGRFVMVGDSGVIYTSTDGATWGAATSGITTRLRSVTFADGLFVAVGDSGRVLTSPDGVTWANRSIASTSTLYGTARHNGLWQIRAGTAIYTSPDAVAWTRVTSNAASVATYRPLVVGGVFLVGTSAGAVDFAENQQTWASVRLDSNTSTAFRSAAVGKGLIVTVGTGGLIFTAAVPTQFTPPLPAPTLRMEADSIKVAVGKKNVLSASGAGFTKLELYANGVKVSELDGPAGALSWTPTTVGNYLLSVRGIDATGASAVSTSFPAVAAFANWKWRNSAPVGTDLRGAVRVDDRWWIVGGGGTLLTLDDAGNLLPIDFATTQQLNAIAYANGRFVIATTDLDGGTKEDIGGLWTSADGHAWTPFLTGALDSANLNCVLHALGRWIGLGTGGSIVHSMDGLSWPRTASGITQSIYSAAEGNGLVVAVAAGGRIITSSDGLTWTSQTSGITTDLRAVTFGNGLFVAAGASGVILTSSDGATWTRAAPRPTTNLYAAGFVGGAFVVGGDGGTLLTSPDGVNWTITSPPGYYPGILAIASAPNQGGLLLGRGGELYASDAASGWRRLNRGSGESIQAVLNAGGRFVAVGANSDPLTRATIAPVQYSADGITWTRAPANPAFTSLNAIAYGQQRYVAVGPASVFTSEDAVTWTRSSFPGTNPLTGVAAGPDAFVAVSSNQTIFSSADGATWTQRASSTGAPLRAVAYGNGRYVAVGDSGSIRTSTDAAAWNAPTSGTTSHLQHVAWFDDLGFVAVGNAGTMLVSGDGTTWRPVETGVADNLTRIAKTPVGWVASGGASGTLIVSLDGESWSISAAPVDKTIRGLAASSSAVVAAGDNGAILTFEFADSTPAPVIVAQPAAPGASPGLSVKLTVSAQNATGAVYQWLKNDTLLAGENKPVLVIPTLNAATAGRYTVSITTPTGRVVSSPVVLSLTPVADPGRLINLSVLTALESAADEFTFGVVIGGGTTGSKPLLVRAAGPSLAPLGVGDALEDPKLEFFTGTTKVGENDNWSGAAVSTAMSQVGAFPFPPGGRDAAIWLPALARGASSARIFGTGTGTVLAELYDATPAGTFTVATPRMINVSVLKHIGSGVTAGFVVGGSTARRVLVRAVGPTLGAAPFNVGGVVGDPRLELYAGQSRIGSNDDWGGTTVLNAAFAQVGAFPLNAASKDAALLAELKPGSYTVQVTGAGGTTGMALIEVYEVP